MVKKKQSIPSLIVKNRHLLVAIFTFFLMFFVLAGSLDVFASNDFTSSDTSDFGGSGAYVSEGSVASVYDLTEPYPYLYINSSNLVGYDGTFENLKRSSNPPISSYTDQAPSGGVDFSITDGYGYFVPSSISANNVTASFDDNSYYLGSYSWASADSQKYYMNYRFSSAGRIALVESDEGYWIVSDEPLSYAWTRGMAYYGKVVTTGVGEVKEPYGNGLYCIELWNQPLMIPFTNMPIYIASSDGASGFTNFNLVSTDFTFLSDLYNFNNLLRDEVIVDPNAPAPKTESMYNLDFKNTAYYAGDGVQNFYHNNSFNFNQYMLDNASAFTINFEYVFSYKDDSDSIVKHFVYSQSVPLANFMGYSSRMGTGGKMAVPLNCKWFVGSGGAKLSDKLNNLIHAKKGTALEYVYPNEVNGTSDYDVGDVILNDGAITQNTKKSLPYVISPFKEYIEVFTISSNITVSDGSYNSFSFSDSYDWLTGQYSLISSENTKKPYEKENQLPSNYDNSFNAPSTGGNVGSGAVVQYANPTIVVQGGSGLTQAFKLDDVNIASLADTYNYIINTLGDTRDENGFWAVLHDVYDYIPDPIWNIMLLGISTVIGITCVKVSLSLFRDK